MRTAIAVGLRSHGMDVTTTAEADLMSASDDEYIAYAPGEGRVIVTHDHGFLVLATGGIEHPGVCYCHQQKYSTGELLRALLLVNACCTQDELLNHVKFLRSGWRYGSNVSGRCGRRYLDGWVS